MLLVRLALRNGRRNLRRTLLTAATVLCGTALVVVALSWLEGMVGGLTSQVTAISGHIRVMDKDFAAREQLQPTYENIGDIAPIIQRFEGVPGVLGVEPRIAVGATISAGETIGDDFCQVVGARPSYFRDRLKSEEILVAGRWFEEGAREVVLGRTIANALGVTVGGEVLLLSQTQDGSLADVSATVSGIVSSDAMVDQQAFLPLSEAQWMLDLDGGALEILVYTEDRSPGSLKPILAALRALPDTDTARLSELDISAWYERQPWATMTGMIDAITGFIQFFIVFLTALAIFNTMTMSVLERTGEIGVMRAMGLSRAGAMLMFLVEAVVIGAIGGIAGAVVGAGPAWYLQEHGITLGEDFVQKVGAAFPMKATFYADLTPEILVNAVILGLVIATVGALLPAFRASSIQPVTAMRARR